MNKFMTYIKLILLLVYLCFSLFGKAQNTRVSFGLQIAHMYDIGKGTFEQPNGYDDLDLKGLNGDFSKFDLGYGLSTTLEIRNQVGFDMELLLGQMTGQSLDQFYESQLTLFNLGFRTYFLPHSDIHKLNGFFSIGLGLTGYDAKRYFVLDEGLFSKTDGVSFNNKLEFGGLFMLSKSVKIEISSGVLQTYSDALDGYDNQKLGDPIIRTKFAIQYSLFE
jgi:hypothetical protein